MLRCIFSFLVPVPYKMASSPFLGIISTGISSENLYAWAMASKYIRAMLPPSATFQPLALMAPWLMDSFLLGITSAGSISL